MRRTATMLAMTLLAGCGGNGPEKLPAVCTSGPGVMASALGSAPAPVRMHGIPISRCFIRQESGTESQIVGGSLLVVAQQLADRAAADPRGPAALRLGYLVGAVRRGAARNGVSAELVRRVEQEAGSVPVAGDSAFRRGLAAGGTSG